MSIDGYGFDDGWLDALEVALWDRAKQRQLAAWHTRQDAIEAVAAAEESRRKAEEAYAASQRRVERLW